MTIASDALAKLAEPLDPKRVKHREGAGGRSLSYLEGHDVVRTANDVFGVTGWSYELRKLHLPRNRERHDDDARRAHT